MNRYIFVILTILIFAAVPLWAKPGTPYSKEPVELREVVTLANGHEVSLGMVKYQARNPDKVYLDIHGLTNTFLSAESEARYRLIRGSRIEGGVRVGGAETYLMHTLNHGADNQSSYFTDEMIENRPHEVLMRSIFLLTNVDYSTDGRLSRLAAEGQLGDPGKVSFWENLELVHQAVMLIHKRTGKKVILTGHSFGGMLTTAYLAGMHTDEAGRRFLPGTPEADARAEMIAGKYVEGSIPNAYPAEIETFKGTFDLDGERRARLERHADNLFKVLGPGFRLFGSGQNTFDRNDRTIIDHAFREFVPAFISAFAPFFGMMGFSFPDAHHFRNSRDWSQYIEQLASGFKGLPLGLLFQMREFENPEIGFPISYSKNRHTPRAVYYAEFDELAGREGIEEHIEFLRETATKPILGVKFLDTGHLGVRFTDIMAELKTPFERLVEIATDNPAYVDNFVKRVFKGDYSVSIDVKNRNVVLSNGETVSIYDVYRELSLEVPKVHRTRWLTPPFKNPVMNVIRAGVQCHTALSQVAYKTFRGHMPNPLHRMLPQRIPGLPY